MSAETYMKPPRLGKRQRNAIYDHVFASMDNEVGGVLVGYYVAPGEAPVITGSIAALAADGARASVTFTHEAWSDIHEALDARNDDAQIIGWYHSHPGFGIFLSEHDLFIHRNFFSDPAQVAFVVDPHSGREGMFGWAEGEVVKLEERDTTRPGQRPDPRRVEEASPAETPRANYLAVGIAALILGFAAWLAFLQPSDEQAAKARPTPAKNAKPAKDPKRVGPADRQGKRNARKAPNGRGPTPPADDTKSSGATTGGQRGPEATDTP
jgi:proteasome lid subunit RPN8/RPN11